MGSQVHALAEKMFRKYQEISGNFSNCDGVYLQRRFISKTGECLLKKNSAKTVFYIATLISSKLWIFPVHSLMRRDFSFSAFPFFDQERFFVLPWILEMKSAVLQHSTSFKKVERYVYDQFLGESRKYFFLILSNQEKNNSEVSVKYLTIFFRISTSGTY